MIQSELTKKLSFVPAEVRVISETDTKYKLPCQLPNGIHVQADGKLVTFSAEAKIGTMYIFGNEEDKTATHKTGFVYDRVFDSHLDYTSMKLATTARIFVINGITCLAGNTFYEFDKFQISLSKEGRLMVCPKVPSFTVNMIVNDCALVYLTYTDVKVSAGSNLSTTTPLVLAATDVIMVNGLRLDVDTVVQVANFGIIQRSETQLKISFLEEAPAPALEDFPLIERYQGKAARFVYIDDRATPKTTNVSVSVPSNGVLDLRKYISFTTGDLVTFYHDATLDSRVPMGQKHRGLTFNRFGIATVGCNDPRDLEPWRLKVSDDQLVSISYTPASEPLDIVSIVAIANLECIVPNDVLVPNVDPSLVSFVVKSGPIAIVNAKGSISFTTDAPAWVIFSVFLGDVLYKDDLALEIRLVTESVMKIEERDDALINFGLNSYGIRKGEPVAIAFAECGDNSLVNYTIVREKTEVVIKNMYVAFVEGRSLMVDLNEMCNDYLMKIRVILRTEPGKYIIEKLKFGIRSLPEADNLVAMSGKTVNANFCDNDLKVSDKEPSVEYEFTKPDGTTERVSSKKQTIPNKGTYILSSKGEFCFMPNTFFEGEVFVDSQYQFKVIIDGNVSAESSQNFVSLFYVKHADVTSIQYVEENVGKFVPFLKHARRGSFSGSNNQSPIANSRSLVAYIVNNRRYTPGSIIRHAEGCLHLGAAYEFEHISKKNTPGRAPEVTYVFEDDVTKELSYGVLLIGTKVKQGPFVKYATNRGSVKGDLNLGECVIRSVTTPQGKARPLSADGSMFTFDITADAKFTLNSAGAYSIALTSEREVVLPSLTLEVSQGEESALRTLQFCIVGKDRLLRDCGNSGTIVAPTLVSFSLGTLSYGEGVTAPIMDGENIVGMCVVKADGSYRYYLEPTYTDLVTIIALDATGITHEITLNAVLKTIESPPVKAEDGQSSAFATSLRSSSSGGLKGSKRKASIQPTDRSKEPTKFEDDEVEEVSVASTPKESSRKEGIDRREVPKPLTQVVNDQKPLTQVVAEAQKSSRSVVAASRTLDPVEVVPTAASAKKDINPATAELIQKLVCTLVAGAVNKVLPEIANLLCSRFGAWFKKISDEEIEVSPEAVSSLKYSESRGLKNLIWTIMPRNINSTTVSLDADSLCVLVRDLPADLTAEGHGLNVSATIKDRCLLLTTSPTFSKSVIISMQVRTSTSRYTVEITVNYVQKYPRTLTVEKNAEIHLPGLRPVSGLVITKFHDKATLLPTGFYTFKEAGTYDVEYKIKESVDSRTKASVRITVIEPIAPRAAKEVPVATKESTKEATKESTKEVPLAATTTAVKESTKKVSVDYFNIYQVLGLDPANAKVECSSPYINIRGLMALATEPGTYEIEVRERAGRSYVSVLEVAFTRSADLFASLPTHDKITTVTSNRFNIYQVLGFSVGSQRPMLTCASLMINGEIAFAPKSGLYAIRVTNGEAKPYDVTIRVELPPIAAASAATRDAPTTAAQALRGAPPSRASDLLPKKSVADPYKKMAPEETRILTMGRNVIPGIPSGSQPSQVNGINVALNQVVQVDFGTIVVGFTGIVATVTKPGSASLTVSGTTKTLIGQAS